MNPNQNRPAGKSRRSGPRPKISNYSLVGLTAGLSAAFFLHDQFLANSILGNLDDIVTVVLVNLFPVLAVVLSFMGIKDKGGRSDLSRMMGWVGLVVGLGALMVSVIFSHSLLSDNSLLGVYDNLLDSYGSFF